MRAMSSAARALRPTSIVAQYSRLPRESAQFGRYQAWPVPQCGHVTDVVTSAWKT